MPLPHPRHVLRIRQPGDLGVLRGVAGGVAEEARTRGFPSPSFGGFGFIGVVGDLSIVAGWRIASWSAMSALGCDFNRSMQHLVSKYREEDVVYEAATEKIFH